MLLHIEREYHAVPTWVILEYLTALGSIAIGEGLVRGNDWRAMYCVGETVMFGKTRVGTVRVEFDGEAAALEPILAAFDLKMVRLGG